MTTTLAGPYVMSTDLWAPQANGVRKTIELLNQRRQPILYGPTGCGKTRMATELMLWANHYGMNGVFYVNRNLLLGQTRDRFEASGLSVGVRSAIYSDMLDLDAPFQVVSAQTEAKRVWDTGVWPLHDAQLVVIDEGHLQRTKSIRKTVDEYARRGAMIVLLTATPVGMVEWANEIVISGSMQEYRDCKAIVMANCKGVEVPDLSKIKRSVTGEYIMDGRKRKMYQQHIAGNVIANWKRFNPYAAPAMGFAPGKPESIYMVDKFAAIGSRWAHVDANDAYFDGKRYKLTRQLWTEISEQYKDNRFHGIWSRMKLREGIDFPFTHHVILATPIGSLQSYIQTVGRGLRWSKETPEEVLVTDHGGNYLNHGSPNADRPWDVLAWQSQAVASNYHREQMLDGKKPESIVCPTCLTERPSGIVCPKCKTHAAAYSRQVREEDGQLVTYDRRLVPKRKTVKKPDTQKLWNQLYFGYVGKKNNQSFSQMYNYFYHIHRYHPPRNLQYMPLSTFHWSSHVHTVDRHDLR